MKPASLDTFRQRLGNAGSGWWFPLLWAPYALLVHRFWFIADDAFISFRYAKNLAQGRGLRYNLGEPVPVEGYSNFLWTVLCAGVERLHADVTRWPLLVSFLCGSGLLLLFFLTLRRRLGLDLPVAILATLLLGCSPAYAVWSTSGLETMAFALLLFAGFQQLILRPQGIAPFSAGVLCLALALVRVEGIFWVVALMALAALSRRSAGQKFLRPLAVAAGLVLVGYAAYWSWRYSYYRLPFANSAYVKAAFSLGLCRRGVHYVLWNYLTLLTPLLALPGLVSALRPGRRPLGLAAGAMAAIAVAYGVAVGGDFMTMGRLLVPVLPFHFMLAGWWLQDLRGATPRGRVVAAAVGALALLAGLLAGGNVPVAPKGLLDRFYFRYGIKRHHTEYEYWLFMTRNVAYWTREGKALAAYAPADASVVLGAIGAAGYYSNLFVYDRCGLVTRKVAGLPLTDLSTPGHDKCQPPEFFLPEKPDLLFTFSAAGDSLEKHAADLKAKDYSDRYVADFVPLPEPGGKQVQYLFVCRRLRPDETAASAWAEVDRRLQALDARGD